MDSEDIFLSFVLAVCIIGVVFILILSGATLQENIIKDNINKYGKFSIGEKVYIVEEESNGTD